VTAAARPPSVALEPGWPPAAASGFLTAVAAPWADLDAGMPLCVARFEPACFSSALFEGCGIALPDSVRRSVPKRQAEFLAGRLCARAVLRRFGHAEHVVGVGARREPLWPDGVLGSITHGGGYAAAVLCRPDAHAGIGIDIEAVVDVQTRASLLALVVTQAELALLRQAAGTLSDDHLLTLVFSAKESFFKAAYRQVGQYFGFECLALTHCDVAARTLELRCTTTLATGLPAGLVVRATWELLDARTVFTRVLLAAPGAPTASAGAASAGVACAGSVCAGLAGAGSGVAPACTARWQALADGS
jgi:4'-phosphopantetheinyl transferase EntD